MPLDGDDDDAPPKLHYNARPGNTNSSYFPTEKSRTICRKLAMLGVPHEQIAKKLGIDGKTLRRHYREDLDEGDVEAFASVAGALWHNAVKNNNVVAQIFWMKARHGWIDRREVNHNHSVGPMLSHEERLKMLEADPPTLEHPVHKAPIIDGDVVAAERAAEEERRTLLDGMTEAVRRVEREEEEAPGLGDPTDEDAG
jgi:hypothetical protein